MSKDEEIIEPLVLGGIVGAVLGALISNKNNGSGAITGALAGAAILGTFKANERAQKSNTPILVEEAAHFRRPKWFGQKETCRIPAQKERGKLLA